MLHPYGQYRSKRVTESIPSASIISREGLLNGSALEELRLWAHPGSSVLSDDEIADSCQAAFEACPDRSSVWVFGYGSLIWNPTLDFVETRVARLRGWQRRFCLSTSSRGSPDCPGVMLALDSGGSCDGVAFRIEEAKLESEMRLLWHREMCTGSYHARWLTAETKSGCITVLAFVANHKHDRFVGHLSESEIVDRISFASGPLGSLLDYFLKTHLGLAEFGIVDHRLNSLADKIEARLNSELRLRPKASSLLPK